MSEELGPNGKELLEAATNLKELLEDPHPGLHTWHEAVHRQIDRIAKFHEEER